MRYTLLTLALLPLSLLARPEQHRLQGMMTAGLLDEIDGCRSEYETLRGLGQVWADTLSMTPDGHHVSVQLKAFQGGNRATHTPARETARLTVLRTLDETATPDTNEEPVYSRKCLLETGAERTPPVARRTQSYDEYSNKLLDALELKEIKQAYLDFRNHGFRVRGDLFVNDSDQRTETYTLVAFDPHSADSDDDADPTAGKMTIVRTTNADGSMKNTFKVDWKSTGTTVAETYPVWKGYTPPADPFAPREIAEPKLISQADAEKLAAALDCAKISEKEYADFLKKKGFTTGLPWNEACAIVHVVRYVGAHPEELEKGLTQKQITGKPLMMLAGNVGKDYMVSFYLEEDVKNYRAMKARGMNTFLGMGDVESRFVLDANGTPGKVTFRIPHQMICQPPPMP